MKNEIKRFCYRVVLGLIVIIVAVYLIVLPLSHPTLTSSEMIIAYWPHYLIGAILILLVFWAVLIFEVK